VYEFIYVPQTGLGTPYADDAIAIADDIFSATSGRVKITVKGAGGIVSGHDITEAVDTHGQSPWNSALRVIRNQGINESFRRCPIASPSVLFTNSLMLYNY